MKRVLITFGGGHLAIGVSRALKAAPEPIHIIATDSSKYHLHQADADEIHLLVRGDDPRYLDVLRDVAEDSDADYIWPMHDEEIASLAAARDSFPFRTWLPPIDTVNLCQDKMATFMLLRKSDVPVPNSARITTRVDLEGALRDFGEVWLRPVTGAGSRGAFRATRIEHAAAWLDINDGWGDFMASDVLSGTVDFGYEAIWRDGYPVVSQVLTRLVRGNVGISIPGVQSRTVVLNDAPLDYHRVSELAVRAIMPRPDGIFRVDLMPNSDGVPCVTEVDVGRFGAGGIAYWHRFGVNFPYLALKLGFGESTGLDSPIINPCPKDVVAIQGINRDASFVKLSDVEAGRVRLEERVSRLGQPDGQPLES